MPSEKSPGLKILWVWTLGTAASTLSFSYIIYSRSYTHTHTYLSFLFLQYLLRVWCGQDWGTWRLSWTDNNNRNPFPLMCFWRTRCRGLRMLCEKKYHRFRSNTPLLFLFIYWNLRFCLCFIGIWRVWKSMRTMCLLDVLNENVKSHFGFVYLAMFSSLIIDYINM